MTLAFSKMHGLGNDFVIIDLQHDAQIPCAARWRALADRHTGIGFDQALVILPPQHADAVARYRIYNADGGEVEQCGNGVRCVAEWLRMQGRVPPGIGTTGDPLPLRLDSAGGRVEARFAAAGQVTVNMGVPQFAANGETTLVVDGVALQFMQVSMGNPHAVLRVDAVEAAPVGSLGARLEAHPFFPQRTNVGFLQIVDAQHGRLRVFERGVGETRACGTGACAAMASGRRLGLLEERAQLSLPGGSLELHWPGEGAPLWMTGPVALAFRGEVDF